MNYLPFIVSRVMDDGTDPATEGGRNIDDRNFVALFYSLKPIEGSFGRF
jgi:hypothetical protein